ncbi:MAG: ABC transporter transmembrane domain-containing protein [Saprospiraceae bacterium]|nr:ABC transporter transmembrane domain-containing protein [Saprospiraceae bacterium]
MARQQSEEQEEQKKRPTREQFSEAIKIFKYIRPYRAQFITGMVLLFVGSLIFMAFPQLFRDMVDTANGEGQYGFDLEQLGFVLLILIAVQGFSSYARVMLFAKVSEYGIADVRKALYDKVITLPVVFFEKSNVGELISRLSGDVEKLYSTFSITLAEFVRQIIILVAGVILLGVSTPRLALLMLGTFVPVVGLAMFFGRKIRTLSKARQEEHAVSSTIVNESLQGIQTVKSYVNELFESLRYGRSIQKSVNISMKYARARALFAAFIITILFGALFFIIWRAAVMLQNGMISNGDLIAFFSYTVFIGTAIAGLGNFYTELVGAMGATERIRNILSETGELEIDKKGIEPLGAEGNIRFEQVHFQYPTRLDVPVLKGLDLELKAGEKIALVGPSGAGKSTVMQLLQRFYSWESGSIFLDGQDINSYDLKAFRNIFAIVPQEVILFGGSIKENILYGKPDATEEELIEAAKKANAWEFISKFPEGLDTLVGERGVKLSGGQKQRLAIARAILKDPLILLLDEATSALDAESEKLVQDALDVLMEGRTSIIIAHRLATIRDVDCIYVIEDGKVVESGRHNVLVEKEGLYSQLASLQFNSI